jgi:arylsulfatase A-like enzyme
MNPTMTRRDFAKMAAVSSLVGAFPAAAAAANPTPPSPPPKPARKPNLLFVFPDQFRLFSLGIWRHRNYRHALRSTSDPVVTPTLDQLAQQSVLFTQACSSYPVCSPYRGMLMSGMYPANNGVETNCRQGRPDSLRHDVDCLTDVLHAQGYATAYVGKTHWEHNQNLFDDKGNYVGMMKAPGGHHMNEYDTYIPPGRGRHSIGFWFQCIADSHKDPRVYASDPRYVGGRRDGQQYRPAVYSPKLEADVIIDYLKNDKHLRDPDRPFSLIWAPNPPQNPYANEKDCDEAAYHAFYRGADPDALLTRPNVKGGAATAAAQSAAFYFANVTGIDSQLARVLQALDEAGEADNTVVVFTSDHGEMMGSHGLMTKNFIFEESMLVPFMIRFPHQLQHRLEDLMLTPVDIMPTMLGLLGLEQAIPASVEGTNYAHALRTTDFSLTPKPSVTPYLAPNRRGVRSQRHTLLVDRAGNTSLFDNAEDPYQLTNLPLSTIDPATRHDLLAALGSWLKQMNDPWFHQRHLATLIQYPV